MADTTTIQSVIEQRTGPLLVNHWASWCTGCVDELPLLVALHEEYGKQVSFLGVSWEGFQRSTPDLVDTVDTFSKANAVVWDSLIVSDRPDVLFAKMKLPCQTIPQIWLFNAEGDVVYRCEKVLDEVECGHLRKAIERIVANDADSDD